MNQYRLITAHKRLIILIILLTQISLSSHVYGNNLTSCIMNDTIVESVRYDINNKKYMQIVLDKQMKKHQIYFDEHGTPIEEFDWDVAPEAIWKIQDLITSEFKISDETYSSATAVVLLIANKDKIEFRVIKGLTPEFNNELQRVLKEIKEKIIFLRRNNDKTLVIPFGINIRKAILELGNNEEKY